MPITQIRCAADVRELEADTDFGYVPELPDSLKRLAAYYEYARESAELIDAVIELREAGTFNPGHKIRDVKPELTHKFTWKREIYSVAALCTLTKCDEFPEKPFRDALQNNWEALWRVDFSLGVSRPVDLPWDVFIKMRDHFSKTGLTEKQYLEAGRERGSTMHAISIPWSYTNDELAEFFRELIPRIRPREFPEPKKAGRRGRSSGSGAVDMLNQLAAFRLNRAGVDFNCGRKLTPCASGKGWTKAARAAEERISNMAKRPFFAPVTKILPGNK